MTKILVLPGVQLELLRVPGSVESVEDESEHKIIYKDGDKLHKQTDEIFDHDGYFPEDE